MKASAGSPGRSASALLTERTFGLFFAGKLVSSCGIWVQNLAASVLMFQLTRSAFMVGTVTAVQFMGPLLLGVPSGLLADRVDRRKLLACGRVVSGTAAGTLGVTILLRGVDGFGGAPVLLLGIVFTGVGLGLSVAAMQSIVPTLVPDDDLEPAVALSSAAPAIARSVGPAVAAGLLVLGGPGLAFTAAAAAHVLFALSLLTIRPRGQGRSKERPSLLGGFRYVFEDRRAALLLMAIAFMAFGIDPILTLTPSLADAFGGGSDLVGLFAAAFGVGSVVLTVVLRSMRRVVSLPMIGTSGFWVVAAGLLAIAFGPAPWVAVIGFAVCGTGYMMASIALNTRIQRRVPDELRGRVMALWGIAFLGARPIAGLVNGLITDLTSVRFAMVVAAVIMLGSSLATRVRYGPPGAAPTPGS